MFFRGWTWSTFMCFTWFYWFQFQLWFLVVFINFNVFTDLTILNMLGTHIFFRSIRFINFFRYFLKLFLHFLKLFLDLKEIRLLNCWQYCLRSNLFKWRNTHEIITTWSKWIFLLRHLCWTKSNSQRLLNLMIKKHLIKFSLTFSSSM